MQFLSAKYRCSFCGAPASIERQLIAGPFVFICNGCVSIASLALIRSNDSAATATAASSRGQRECCSFCGKSPRTDTSIDLVLGSEKSICSNCVNLCDDIIIERTVGKWSGHTVVLRPRLPLASFELKQTAILTELRKTGSCRVVVLLAEPSDAQAARDILSTVAESIPSSSVVSNVPTDVENQKIAIAEMIEIRR
jgi:hypothetical protein